MNTAPEILAPAGDWSHLSAALNAGADAVYFGAGELNMRSTAPNFSVDDFPEIAERCHAHGARVYLTLNTLVFEEELDTVETIIAAAAKAGIDAVIGWDPAVLMAAQRHHLELHLSTQASVANRAALQAYKEHYGIQRVVLARECTLQQVTALHSGCPDVELEVFAHGAMCVAVSGRCFLSAFQYGKSANRGECYQSCRREYQIVNEEEDFELTVTPQHIMSPQDLCTLPFLEKLIEAGVRSFKIEGRNRSPEYVSAAVTAYREVRDAILRGDDPDKLSDLKQRHITQLGRVFNRGFSSGFYMGRPIDQWTGGGSESTVKKEVVGIVTNYFAKVNAAEVLVQASGFELGDTLRIQGPTTGNLEFDVSSIQIDGESVSQCERGRHIAIAVPDRVRRNDRVFLVKPA